MSESSVEATTEIVHPKKIAFLENYPKFIGVVATCEAIDISPVTYWRWCNADEVFSKHCNDIKKEIGQRRLEKYEAELEKRALGGESKQSDILLMFGLKAEDPSKYREKQSIPMIMGDITIKMAIPAYDEKLRLTNGRVIEGEAREIT